MNAKAIYQKQAHLFPVTMAFLLPFNAGVAIVSAVWLVAFLCFGEVKASVSQLLKNKWVYVPVAFFLLHVIALLYTQNKTEAGFSIEIKLSFLVYPFLIFSHRFNNLEVREIVTGYITGCLVACLYNLGRATYYYATKGLNYFYYSDFTGQTHPSYFAMFLVMAVLLLVLWYPKWFPGNRRATLFMLCPFLLFSVCIFISASKLGIISYALLVPATLFYLQLAKKNYKRLALVAAGIVLLFLLSYHFFPQPFSRIQNAIRANSEAHIDKTSRESTVVRKLVWHEASEIIKDNVWIGVGPGDANDELYKAYERNGMEGALFKHLNAHNQYLQTFLGLGLPGFLLLGVMTLFAATWAITRRNASLFLFSLLIIMNFLVESMLQTQAGTLFFVFFFCWFLQYNYRNIDHTLTNQPTP